MLHKAITFFVLHFFCNAKIVPMSAMKACFLIAECSLSYAKIVQRIYILARFAPNVALRLRLVAASGITQFFHPFTTLWKNGRIACTVVFFVVFLYLNISGRAARLLSTAPCLHCRDDELNIL